MKIFLKWTRNAMLFLLIVVVVKMIGTGFKPERLAITFVYLITASLALGFLFYIVEVHYWPWRKRKLIKKLENKFNGQALTDTIVKFSIGEFDLYAEISLKLVMSQTGSGEFITFHIPRTQIDNLEQRPDFKYIRSVCYQMESYQVYETNSMGLGIARRRMEKKLGERES